jgi:sugar lactone lactonase YvrE
MKTTSVKSTGQGAKKRVATKSASRSSSRQSHSPADLALSENNAPEKTKNLPAPPLTPAADISSGSKRDPKKPWGWISLALIGLAVLVSAEVVFLLKSNIDQEYELKTIKTIGERAGEPDKPGRFWGPMLLRINPDTRQLGLVDINFRKVICWDYQTNALLGEVKAGVVGNDKFSPNNMCFDAQGNILVSDLSQSRLYKISPDFTLLSQWEVRTPVDVAVNSQGHILVIRGTDHDVMEYDADGGNPRILIASKLRKPYHLSCDAQDNLYILDLDQKSILVFSAKGKFSHAWKIKTQSLSAASALAVRNDKVYFCETNLNQIQVFSKRGKLLQKARLPYPVSLDVDQEGKIYMPGPTAVYVYEMTKKFSK